MPTANEIREYAAQQALQQGLNPGLVIGVIEQLSSYNPKFSSGTRRGLMGIPKDAIPENVKYSDWKKQVELGTNLLALAKRDAGGLDIGAAVLYMGSSPDAPDQLSVQKAIRAYTRGAKYTGENIDQAMLDDVYSSFNIKSNAAADLKASGLDVARLAKNKPAQLSREEIRALAEKYAPDYANEIDALSGVESSYGANPAAYAPNGDKAIGPLQIISKGLGGKYGNFERYAVDGMNDPTNPVHSTVAGIRMFSDLAKKNKGNVEAAVNEYFTGVPNPPDSRRDSNISVAQYRDKFFSNLNSGAAKSQTVPQDMPQDAMESPAPILIVEAENQVMEQEQKQERAKTLDERIAAALDLTDSQEPEDVPAQVRRYIEAQF